MSDALERTGMAADLPPRRTGRFRWLGFGRRSAGQAKKPAPVLLAGYAGTNFWKRHRRLLAIMFGVFAFFYGAIFSLFTTYVVLQLSVPLVILALLTIWLLPNTDRVPVGALNKLMFAFLVLTICWPNYLAVALPGMPWITIIRLVTVPLAVVMLITMSVSARFRSSAKEIIDAAPAVWKMLCIFAVLTFLSVFVSKDISGSASKFVVAQLSWTLIFFTAAVVFVRPGNATRLCYVMWLCAIVVCAVGFQEWRHESVPWVGHIPEFLKVNDPSVERVLSASSRSATGQYRVKSVFTTPLGLGELLAFATPFIGYIIVSGRRLWVRAAACATIPALFTILIGSDSRLGMIGFFQTVFLYILAWGVMRWRDRPHEMVGRVVVLAYPAMAGAFFLLSLVWTRLSNMIWGGGATVPSTVARKEQIAEGIPMVFKAPWGHGIGQAADTLGHFGGNNVLTIDTYYLSIALEYGVVGFIVYYGMFLAALYLGVKALLRSTEPETRVLIPLLIALANFVVIKSVFSQESNHPIVFCILGAVVALIYRVQGTAGHTKRVQEQLAGRRMILPGRRPVVAHAKVTRSLP